MRKCRNWQTSKTKDLVIIAIVWVQVPSSALNNKTGTKQSVWSLSCCSKPKRALNPWFKVSPPARSARGMRSPGPHSPHLPQGSGRCGAGAHGSKVYAPLRSLQNRRPPDVLRSTLRFGRRRADIPRMSCAPSSAWLRLLRGRRPWVQGLRSASVVAEQTYPGRLAVSAPLRSLQNRRPLDVLQPIFRMVTVVMGQALQDSRLHTY